MSDIEPDDRVIRELDVYISNDLSASKTQLVICQFPLRPPWRPYDIDQVNSVRFKNEAKRLEVDVPIDASPQNYDDSVEAHMKLTQTSLRSTKVDTKTSYAVGVLAGDKIILAPVNDCYQLRPTMSYLDAVTKKAAVKEEDAEEEEEATEQAELAAVEIQVKKRETERQQAARLNSYAHLAQKEAEEPWLQLNVHPSGTPVSDHIWDTFIKPTEAAVGTPMSLEAYLAAVVPQMTDGSRERSTDGLTAVLGAATVSDQTKTSEEATKQLPRVLKAMFEKRKVCSMADIRQWLTDYGEAGAAKEAVALTDRALHDAIVASGNVVCIRRTYLQTTTGNAAVDPIRSLLIDLLRDKDNGVKKGEVADLAKANNVKWGETTFSKVAREICFNRGNQWFLKPSADA